MGPVDELFNIILAFRSLAVPLPATCVGQCKLFWARGELWKLEEVLWFTKLPLSKLLSFTLTLALMVTLLSFLVSAQG